MESRRPGGRRPGNPPTREAILRAAIAAFTEKGYTATTIRGVARAAGVDPALVVHFFGGKERLFQAAMRAGGMPARRLVDAVPGDPATLGERVLRRYLELWEHPEDGARLRAVVGAAFTSPSAADLVRSFLAEEILRPMIEAASLDHGETRAALVTSHLVGIAYLRYVLRVEPVAALTVDELVAWAGPALQRYITGPPPALPHGGAAPGDPGALREPPPPRAPGGPPA